MITTLTGRQTKNKAKNLALLCFTNLLWDSSEIPLGIVCAQNCDLFGWKNTAPDTIAKWI